MELGPASRKGFSQDYRGRVYCTSLWSYEGLPEMMIEARVWWDPLEQVGPRRKKAFLACYEWDELIWGTWVYDFQDILDNVANPVPSDWETRGKYWFQLCSVDRSALPDNLM